MDKEDLLRCSICGKEFINAYDEILKDINPYVYKPNCDCLNKDLRISVG